ncbi:hypothetical protein GCM10027431_23050 [Lysobacter rhizosphaerae]
MSNVVQFLEALARNPKPLSHEEFIAAVVGANLDPVIRKALLERDVQGLSRELGGRSAMFCAIFPADNEEPNEGEEQEDGGEAPEQETTSRAA